MTERVSDEDLSDEDLNEILEREPGLPRRLARCILDARRERDTLSAALAREEENARTWSAYANRAEKERDEARAEAKRAGELFDKGVARVVELEAEVARLRAALEIVAEESMDRDEDAMFCRHCGVYYTREPRAHKQDCVITIARAALAPAKEKK